MNNRERLQSLEKIDDIMRDVCQLQVSTSELGNSDTEEKLRITSYNVCYTKLLREQVEAMRGRS